MQYYIIQTLNVNGIKNPIKRSKIISKLKREQVGIGFLQETHLSNEEHEKIKKMGHRKTYYASHRSGKKRGVAILIPNSIRFDFIAEHKDKEGRYVLLRGKLEQEEVTLCNIYAPPGSSIDFFKEVFSLVAAEASGTCICAGDFNLLLNPKMDTTNRERGRTRVEKQFKKIMQESGLTDIWRSLHKYDREFTFYSTRHKVYTRIDYFFMFNKDLHRVKDCVIGQRDISDHSGLTMKINLARSPKNTLWRLNTSLLNSTEFKTEMAEELKTYLEFNDNGTGNPTILWDAAKAYIRGKIIVKCANLKKIRARKLSDLQENLKRLERLHSINKSPSLLEQMRPVKQEIHKILNEEIEKKLKYMRQRYYEAGPKAAKVLSWRLRKQQVENTIYKVRNPRTNKITSKLEEIQSSFEAYYAALYTQPDKMDNQTIQKFLNSLDLPSIGKNQNDKLMAEISAEEVDRGISNLKTNKSPGCDGFPPEWYKAMRESVLPLLKASFNYTLGGGALPPSWREAFISVIPKVGKDKTDPKGYRPISVLNIDYKLYAAILAKRLSTLMPFLIDEDQTGFIGNRQTHDSIRRAVHVTDHITKEKSSAVLLSLDAEKAYDTVGWEFLFQVMKRFGFCDRFIQCIKNVYSSPKARIKINGSLSNQITLQRGCRQGCPLSPLLFNLFIEPLAQVIREEAGLEGVTIGNVENKICLYADDVLVVIKNPESGIPLLMNILETYGRLSGYKLNIQKTQNLTLNFVPSKQLVNSFQFNWRQLQIEYLGIILTKNLAQLYEVNYKRINKKIYEDLDRWSLLPLDLGSRIQTIKINVLPRLLYVFTALPVEVPAKQFREWDKHFSRFIWSNKRPRVRYSTLQLPGGRGGMGLPCLVDYYLSAQIRPLVCWCNPAYDAKWKDIELSLMDVPIQSVLGCLDGLPQVYQLQNLCLNLSLKKWAEVVKKFNLLKQIEILSWPAYHPRFLPAAVDHKYRRWAKQGITAFCNIIKNGELVRFEDLCRTYDVGRQDFYHYLQVRSFFRKEIKTYDFDAEPGIIQIIMDSY
uniref:Reverse transcriptase domain-containing protein n=1 Tax=Poecilia mexicana TaxID=48701 RepID=A0A3B3XJ11_9TELE